MSSLLCHCWQPNFIHVIYIKESGVGNFGNAGVGKYWKLGVEVGIGHFNSDCAPEPPKVIATHHNCFPDNCHLGSLPLGQLPPRAIATRETATLGILRSLNLLTLKPFDLRKVLVYNKSFFILWNLNFNFISFCGKFRVDVIYFQRVSSMISKLNFL